MSEKYRAEQDVAISAWETGAEIEIRMVVHFTVHPGCKASMEGPAEEPTAEVDRIQFFEIKGGKPSPDECGMAPWLLDRLSDGEEFYGWLLSEAADQHEAALDAKAEARREELQMGDRI